MRKRNQISGQFSAKLIEMLESPAWRTLSLSARRIIERIEIELANHGGNDNGRLPVTYQDFVDHGIHLAAVAPAIREAEALGFIRITERGRGGNAEFRSPNLFLLTFAYGRGSRSKEPVHDWRRIKTMSDAQAFASVARRAKKIRRAPPPPRDIDSTAGKRSDPVLSETGSGKLGFSLSETSSETTVGNQQWKMKSWATPQVIEVTEPEGRARILAFWRPECVRRHPQERKFQND